MKGKVYIVMEPMRRDRDTGRMVPCMDLTSAGAYGNIEVLLERRDITLSPGPMLECLRRKLRTFSDNDYLLGVGDPGAMMAASMIASQMNRGKVNILKWDRKSSSYIELTLSA